MYEDIDKWRTRPLEGDWPYVLLDGVWHIRSWGGAVENVSMLVAIGVGLDGHREVIGVAEGLTGGCDQLSGLHPITDLARSEGGAFGSGQDGARDW